MAAVIEKGEEMKSNALCYLFQFKLGGKAIRRRKDHRESSSLELLIKANVGGESTSDNKRSEEELRLTKSPKNLTRRGWESR